MQIVDSFTPARCLHCGERDRILTGDGVVVCRPCVYRFGHLEPDHD